MTRVSGRTFLFLQGLAGPFFAHLGRTLLAAGHGVHRINFNGGDRSFWSLPGAVDYRGSAGNWPRFLEERIARWQVTDIVLFGDCRPMHQAAIALARSLQVQIHVFEEGYIRPDFVTLEVGGVNGHSGLSRDPDDYLAAARTLPPLPELPPVASSFGRRAWEDVCYNLTSLAMAPLYPGYRTHRPWPILVEYAGWLARLARKGRAKRRSVATLEALAADGRPYHVFPLQLDCDSQIRIHSHFKGIAPAIERVLTSFARHAPQDELLVVKGHPLDNGLKNWGRVTLDTAGRLGIADRVLFVEEADIALLVMAARGVVTVNSTTGTLSLAFGVPTKVLGDAVYDIPRVTDQRDLDLFWADPMKPDMAVYDAFRRVLVDRCLIHGGYFSDDGLDRLANGAARRLEAARSNLPVLRHRLAPLARPARSGLVLR